MVRREEIYILAKLPSLQQYPKDDLDERLRLVEEGVVFYKNMKLAIYQRLEQSPDEETEEGLLSIIGVLGGYQRLHIMEFFRLSKLHLQSTCALADTSFVAHIEKGDTTNVLLADLDDDFDDMGFGLYDLVLKPASADLIDMTTRKKTTTPGEPTKHLFYRETNGEVNQDVYDFYESAKSAGVFVTIQNKSKKFNVLDFAKLLLVFFNSEMNLRDKIEKNGRVVPLKQTMEQILKSVRDGNYALPED